MKVLKFQSEKTKGISLLVIIYCSISQDTSLLGKEKTVSRSVRDLVTMLTIMLQT